MGNARDLEQRGSCNAATYMRESVWLSVCQTRWRVLEKRLIYSVSISHMLNKAQSPRKGTLDVILATYLWRYCIYDVNVTSVLRRVHHIMLATYLWRKFHFTFVTCSSRHICDVFMTRISRQFCDVFITSWLRRIYDVNFMSLCHVFISHMEISDVFMT